MRDYLYLEFRGDDRLYVPHEQLGKVSRYIGADGSRAGAGEAGRQGVAQRSRRGRASRCASWPASCWRSTPAARRPAAPPFPRDDEWTARLEEAFPYEETDDQQRAIDAVTEDMEAEQPMDRLVCGDVGFGKTEVAVRAAMKAVSGGRQVLVLVPTTVLAQQHGATFRDRFRDFPVRVETVSRFRPPAEVKRVLAEFRDGQGRRPDRHPPRALARRGAAATWGWWWWTRSSASASPRRSCCGRCGWRWTCWRCRRRPIPRTLHMSLSGLRDISVITTPPRGRRPIKTHVGEFDEELIAAALRRELAPRGPVVLPAQPGRDDRRGGRAGALVGARAARRRRPRPDAGAAAGGRDDAVPARRLTTCWSRPRSSSRGSTSPRPTR